ncbi:MAG: MgtC/SapB family protein [Puia sp.]|nr:MgtC/SapB family protein [Puia sp.]
MTSLGEIIWKLVLAILVGAVVGAEREYRSKSAGFRTLTMICLGAAMFTMFSQAIGGSGNPDRIASNIVTGIGFVGAGVIFKGDYRVNGITTAAMIWVTAALGVGIGAGYCWTSVIACLLILLVLFGFTRLEIMIDRINQVREYKIVCSFETGALHRYEELFKQHHLRFIRNRQTKSGELLTGEWVVTGSEKCHHRLISLIIKDPTVKAFDF